MWGVCARTIQNTPSSPRLKPPWGSSASAASTSGCSLHPLQPSDQSPRHSPWPHGLRTLRNLSERPTSLRYSTE